MPEIKNNFTQGKMNKDLDERIIPNGQYRDAMNVQVSTSDGADIGTVQNIMGNDLIEAVVGSGFQCVGSIADEKNNKFYWFIKSDFIEAILEYSNEDTVLPVIIDRKANTADAVLKFSDNIITGINIIDDLLLWTDNINEPRRINIDRCRKGNSDEFTTLHSNPLPHHTKLIVDDFIQTERIEVVSDMTFTGGTTITAPYPHPWINIDYDGTYDLHIKNANDLRVGDQLVRRKKASDGSVDMFVTDEYSKKIKKIVGNTVSLSTEVFPSLGVIQPPQLDVGDILIFDREEDLAEEHITVIKKSPLRQLTVDIQSALPGDRDPLFEKIFPRFSYRYKYADGEYSTFAPFTDVIFNSLYGTNQDGISYDEKTAYNTKEPYNAGMRNMIREVILQDFTSPETPKDVVQIDILYKQENSTAIYLLDTVKRADDEWDLAGSEFDSRYKGSFRIISENIHAALPSNQLLRPWDNVPRKALAQEVTGNRVVYGNYLQNYTNDIPPVMDTAFEERFDYSLEQLIPVYSSNLLTNGNFQNYDKGTGYAVSGFLAPDGWALDDGMSYIYTSPENRSVKIENAPQGAILAQGLNIDLNVGLKYRISFKLIATTTLSPQLSQNPGELEGKLVDPFGNYIEFSGVKAPYKQNSSPQIQGQTAQREIDKPKIFQFEAILKDKGVYETDNLNSFYIKVSEEGSGTSFQDFKGIISDVSVQVMDLDRSRRSFEFGGFPTIKSQRNYQLGVVYGDKYGRETPVFTSADSSVKIPWQDNNLGKLASRSLQLKTNLKSPHPEWADYYKFYVKETSGEYYNLVMDAIYKVTKDDIDKDDHVWMSFPSSDRNKISEDDYIILKKQADESTQIQQENKFRVLDVKNEAPDAIKYRYIKLGEIANTTDSINENSILNSSSGTSPVGVFYIPDSRPIVTSANKFPKELIFSKGNWLDNGGQELINKFDQPDLYFSFTKTTSELGDPVVGSDQQSSKKYKVAAIREDDSTGDYIATLNESITEEDSDLIEDGSTGLIHPDIVVRFEKKITKALETFSGRFFVKILSTNQTKNSLESSNVLDLLLNTVIKVQRSVRWLSDVHAGGSFISDDGLTNQQTFVNPTDLQANEIAGYGNAENITNKESQWEAILTSKTHNGCFIDNMYFASAQLGANGYARDSGPGYKGGTPNVPGDISRGIVNTDVQEKTEIIFEGLDLTYPYTSYSPVFDATFYDDNYKLYRPYKWREYNVDSAIAFPIFNNTKPQEPNSGANLVNGIDGIIKTDSDHVSVDGIRRWRSSVHDADEVSIDTYTKETGKNFLHLSFLGPGKDLFDEANFPNSLAYSASTPNNGKTLCESLQAIWGGGVFTKEDGTPIGTQAVLTAENSNNQLTTVPYTVLSDGQIIPHQTITKFEVAGDVGNNHAVFMEGDPLEKSQTTTTFTHPRLSDHDSESYLGYDKGEEETITHKYKHDTQWDATIQGEKGYTVIKDFISQLKNGGSFVFKNDPDREIYTIKKCTEKKLYNHTPWRRTYKWDSTKNDLVDDGTSVETAVINWALSRNDVDGTVPTSTTTTEGGIMRQKLLEFGKRNNRRVCYVLELDKDVNTKTYNPVDGSNIDADSFDHIQFVEKDYNLGSKEIAQNPAIWETEPKDNVDLDIYYETSQAYPVKITQDTQELFAPVGCEVKFIENKNATQGGLYANENLETSIYLSSWIGPNEFTLSQDINGNQTQTIMTAAQAAAAAQASATIATYIGKRVRFIRKDGEFTTGIITSVADNNINTDSSTFAKLDTITIHPEPGEQTGLSWYNSFTFGNGIESNRIRDDFNAMTISNGVKASMTLDADYKEEERKSGLIYSGIYNSTNGVNNLNQFIQAEKITKDLNPTFGSIQKLFSRRISLVSFCEDRVIEITANKNALYNADGDPQLVATDAVLGDANPFVGDYGISKNPESFAKESYRAYFTDKQRGAVLRLSMDGLTPISDAGMHDYFRDNLKTANRLIGTYDAHKKDYNLTLSDFLPYNVIFNGFLDQGESSIEYFNLRNFVINGDFANGIPQNIPPPPLNFADNPDLNSSVIITNHDEIPAGSLQAGVTAKPNIEWMYQWTGDQGFNVYEVDWTDNTPQEQAPFTGASFPNYVSSGTQTYSWESSVNLQGHNYYGNVLGLINGSIIWRGLSSGTGEVDYALGGNAVNAPIIGNVTSGTFGEVEVWGDNSQQGMNHSIYTNAQNYGQWPFGTNASSNYPGGIETVIQHVHSIDPSMVPVPVSANAPTVFSNPWSTNPSDFSTINNTTMFHGEQIRVTLTVHNDGGTPTSPEDLYVNLYGQLSGSQIEEMIPDGYFSSGYRVGNSGSHPSTIPVTYNTTTTGNGNPTTTNPYDGFPVVGVSPTNPLGLGFVTAVNQYYVSNNPSAANVAGGGVTQGSQVPGQNAALSGEHHKGFVDTNNIQFTNLPVGDTDLSFWVEFEGDINNHFVQGGTITGISGLGNVQGNYEMRKYITKYLNVRIGKAGTSNNKLRIKKMAIEKIKTLKHPGNAINIAHVPSLPPNTINAWAEVEHVATTDWSVIATPSTALIMGDQAETDYGPDTGSGTLSGTNPPYLDPPAVNPNTTTIYNDGTGVSGMHPDSTYVVNDHFDINTNPGQGDFVTLTQDLTDNPLIPNHWYSVVMSDITGTTQFPYSTVVRGVLDPASIGGTTLPDHIGQVADGALNQWSTSDIKFRRYWIPNRYEVIWKHGNGPAPNTELKLFFSGFVGTIGKIKIFDITATETAGSFDNWSMQTNVGGVAPAHYYSAANLASSYHTLHNGNGKAVWENGVQGNFLTQSFSNLTSLQDKALDIPASPGVTEDGYELKFVVSNVTSGSLSGYIRGAMGATDVTDQAMGVEFNGIDADGFYMAKFNMDGTATSIQNYTDASYGTPAASSATLTSSNSTVNSTSWGTMNKIVFNVPAGGGFSGSIDNVSLKDATNYFQSSTSIGWTFHGYDQLYENYINFDEQNRNIVLANLPHNTVGTFPASGTNDGASLQQSIPNHGFVAGDTVNLKFNLSGHPTGDLTGVLTGYFYNDSGDGFHIPFIKNNGNYDFTFVIGDTTPIALEVGGTPANYGHTTNNSIPRNTFVLYSGISIDGSTAGALTGPFSGILDNFILNRVNLDFTPSTVTYSEDVKGWVSFKSFIPESGVSLSKDYYTIKDGRAWKHHYNELRNKFYDNTEPSTVTAVLNTEPSLIKIFNTLGYEGSQSKINKYIPASSSTSGLSNIEAYNLKEDIDPITGLGLGYISGWFVDYITTDKQEGSVNEFIEKEGKWFNYIRGVGNAIPESSNFSFQGLGEIETVTTMI